LNRYPLDTLKVDRSFIVEAENSKRGRLVLKSIVELAQAIGTEIVAEGIETPAQLEHVRRLGIRLGQGRLLGAPAPAGEAGTLLLENANRRWWKRLSRNKAV